MLPDKIKVNLYFVVFLLYLINNTLFLILINSTEALHAYLNPSIIKTSVNCILGLILLPVFLLCEDKPEFYYPPKIVFLFSTILVITLHCLVTSNLDKALLFLLDVVINLVLISFFIAAKQFRNFQNHTGIHTLYAYIALLMVIALARFSFIHISPSFDNQVIFSNYLSFLVVITLMVPKPDKVVYKVTEGLLFFSIFLFAVINSARTGILVLSAAFMMIIIHHYAEHLNKKLLLLLFLAIAGCTLIFLKINSSLGRFFILKHTLDLVAKYPLGGTGFNRFSFYYNLQQAEYFEKNQGTELEKYLADNIYTPNNEILQLLVELGAFCSIVILVYGVKVMYTDLKSVNKKPLPLQLWYTSVLLFLLISYPLHNSVFAYTILISWFFLPPVTEPGQIYLTRQKAAVTLTLALLFLMTCLAFCVIQLKYMNAWKNVEYSNDMSELSYKEYDALYSGIYYDEKFLFKYSKVLLDGGQFTRAEAVLNKLLKYRCAIFFLVYRSDIEFAAHHYQEAEHTLKLAINISPDKFITRSKLMYYYLHIKDTLQAKKQAAVILNLPVKVPGQAITDIKNQCESLLKHD